MLHELIRQDAPDAAIGVLWNPKLAEAAHALGTGSEAEVEIGGFSGDVPEVPPVRARVRVEQLSDGQAIGRGPICRDRQLNLGRAARLRILSGRQGVQVVVASERAQTLDREMLRCTGLDPEAMKILVIKSAVHFRADFAPISAVVLDAGRPGVTRLVVPEELPHRRLRPALRLGPGGPTFADTAAARAGVPVSDAA